MTYDPRIAAATIADAWKSGRQLQELPTTARPGSLAEGYDLQESMLAANAQPIAGWKLGVGSPAGMRAGKLDRPLVGRVLGPRLYRSGDTVKLPNAAPVTVEFEIAFVLGRDIAPGDRIDEPLEAVSEFRTTFELVLSRFVNRRAVGWPSFVGDSVGFEALVVGMPFDRARMAEVATSVVISVDGNEAARGLSGDELTDPATSFDYLIAHARERGQTLKRGEIATLGAIGKPFDVTGAATVEARYLDAKLAVTLTRG